jgi:LPXTG-motif cell wall-anchored protein
MATADTHDAKLDLTTKTAAHRVDRMLDDAIADSFPASDPVALAMPRHRVESGAMRATAESPITWFVLGGGLLVTLALLAFRRR